LFRRRMRLAVARAAGVVDQGALAGASFLSTVLMGRALEPSAFGVFALAFAVLVLAERVQHGLIGAPLLAVPTDPHTRGERGGGGLLVWTLQWRLLALAAVAVAISGAVLSMVVDWPETTPAALAIIPTLLGTQARDLSRYLCYQHQKSRWAALIGGLSGTIQLVTLGALFWVGHLNISTGILALGFSGAAAFLITLPLVCSLYRSTDANGSPRQALWARGRWLAASNVVFWGATQLFLFVAAALLGPAQAGVFRAAQSVLGPTHFVVAGLFNSSAPVVATQLAAGRGTWASVRPAVAVIGGAVAGYCSLVALFPDAILTLLFGSQYSGYGQVVQILAIGYLMTGLAGGMTLVLVVLHRTDLVLRGHVATLLVGLIAAYPLIKWLGLFGAALGLSLVYTVRFVALAFYAGAAGRAATEVLDA